MLKVPLNFNELINKYDKCVVPVVNQNVLSCIWSRSLCSLRNSGRQF